MVQPDRRLAKKTFVAPQVQDYAVRLILATHPQGPFACGVTNRIQHTPTIFLVKNDGSAPVEVSDVDKLCATIDTMLPKSSAKSATTPKEKAAKKSVAQK